MTESARQAVHILVSGIVQGVAYRYWTEETARKLQVAGWVRNLYDGRVEIYAEGDSDALENLLERCKEGPRSARVTDITSHPCKPQLLVSFEIRTSAGDPESL